MNDRVRAMSLLHEAREILAQRLTERVLELGDDLLDDARGESFAGEIDGLYEQIGLRLSQINTLLAGFPPTEMLAAPTGHGPVSTVEVSAASNGLVGFAPHGNVDTSGQASFMAAPSDEPMALRSIVETLIAGDVETAGRLLSWWFETPLERGRNCALAFRERWASQPEFASIAKRLRDELAAGAWHAAVPLWHECFGPPGPDSPRTFGIPRAS
jgi:hypothetical protein